jgi:Dyp-type peroxidase family
MVQTILTVIPGKDYTVHAGDSLWAIAARAYGSGAEWSKIYQANMQTIGKNPNLIFPGQVLHIPLISVPTPTPVPVPTPMPGQPDLPLRTSTEIQGDILAGFNKDYRLYLFLRFPDQYHGRAWLKELIPFIADTKDVAAFNTLFSLARHGAGGKDPVNLKATWVNVDLTLDGLKLLLNADPSPSLIAQGFSSFVAGPEASAATINGDTGPSDPTHWVVGRKDQLIHALLNIQSDDPDDLAVEAQKLRTLAAQYGLSIVYEQDGATLPGDLRGHEQFGYKDGISQPGVKDFDPADLSATDVDPSAVLGYVQGHPGTEIIQAGEFILGQSVESGPGQKPFAPPPDLKWMLNGSFQVFRRLSQDVPGFNEQAQQNLNPLSPDDPLRDTIGALLVGRWKSGTPVDLSPDTDNGLTGDTEINNFNFMQRDVDTIHVTDDVAGLRCPHFGHIRKVYPRQHNFPFSINRLKRIIRRGVPFGNQYEPERGEGFDAKAERGLVFVAYMASIENQFEFLMQAWVNNSAFPVPGIEHGAEAVTGPDPLIGDAAVHPSPITLKHAGGPDLQVDFLRKVQTTGTLYAFAPAISVLKELANGTL